MVLRLRASNNGVMLKGPSIKKGLFKVINSRALRANRHKLERLSNYFLFYIYMKLDLNIKDLDL